MAKVRRNFTTVLERDQLEPGPPEVPAWLNRVQAGLRDVPVDSARNIFLERAFEAVVQITKMLPPKSLEQTAAAGSNVMVLFRACRVRKFCPSWNGSSPLPLLI